VRANTGFKLRRLALGAWKMESSMSQPLGGSAGQFWGIWKRNSFPSGVVRASAYGLKSRRPEKASVYGLAD